MRPHLNQTPSARGGTRPINNNQRVLVSAKSDTLTSQLKKPLDVQGEEIGELEYNIWEYCIFCKKKNEEKFSNNQKNKIKQAKNAKNITNKNQRETLIFTAIKFQNDLESWKKMMENQYEPVSFNIQKVKGWLKEDSWQNQICSAKKDKKAIVLNISDNKNKLFTINKRSTKNLKPPNYKTTKLWHIKNEKKQNMKHTITKNKYDSLPNYKYYFPAFDSGGLTQFSGKVNGFSNRKNRELSHIPIPDNNATSIQKFINQWLNPKQNQTRAEVLNKINMKPKMQKFFSELNKNTNDKSVGLKLWTIKEEVNGKSIPVYIASSRFIWETIGEYCVVTDYKNKEFVKYKKDPSWSPEQSKQAFEIIREKHRLEFLTINYSANANLAFVTPNINTNNILLEYLPLDTESNRGNSNTVIQPSSQNTRRLRSHATSIKPKPRRGVQKPVKPARTARKPAKKPAQRAARRVFVGPQGGRYIKVYRTNHYTGVRKLTKRYV